MKVTLKADYKAICPDWEPSLTVGRIYHVIGIEADSLRIISDYGDPVLFDPEVLTVLDPCEPEDWITEYGEEGERYAYPPQLNGDRFWEYYFNGVREAVETFWDYVRKWGDGD